MGIASRLKRGGETPDAVKRSPARRDEPGDAKVAIVGRADHAQGRSRDLPRVIGGDDDPDNDDTLSGPQPQPGAAQIYLVDRQRAQHRLDLGIQRMGSDPFGEFAGEVGVAIDRMIGRQRRDVAEQARRHLPGFQRLARHRQLETIVEVEEEDIAVVGMGGIAAIVEQRQRLLVQRARGHRIPFGACGDRGDGFEHLRQFALARRHRHRLHPDGDLDGAIRIVRRLDGEGQGDRRRNPGSRLVADHPRHFDERAALRRGADIGFVGDALAVEAEHVERRREAVEQRVCRIVGRARA